MIRKLRDGIAYSPTGAYQWRYSGLYRVQWERIGTRQNRIQICDKLFVASWLKTAEGTLFVR